MTFRSDQPSENYGLCKPVEWSEEDEAILNEIIAFFKDGTVKLQHDLSLYAEWLKSLRSKPHWKPSEEQMKALQVVIEHGVAVPDREASLAESHLESLYNDLKALTK